MNKVNVQPTLWHLLPKNFIICLRICDLSLSPLKLSTVNLCNKFSFYESSTRILRILPWWFCLFYFVALCVFFFTNPGVYLAPGMLSSCLHPLLLSRVVGNSSWLKLACARTTCPLSMVRIPSAEVWSIVLNFLSFSNTEICSMWEYFEGQIICLECISVSQNLDRKNANF